MKKEANGKKRLTWLWILIAILALLAIAGGVLAFIFLGGPAEDEVVEPEKRMSDLYWNVDRKLMIDPETGLSAREAAADGMYYLRLAVNGEQIEMPVADKKLVNRMDILDVFGIEFDAEGNAVDLIPVEEMYTKIGEKVFVQSIDGNTAILNTSQALNGMQIPITLTGDEDVFNVSTLERPEFDGAADKLEIMDQVLVFGTDESTPHTFYITDRFWESDVYWRTVRKYDSSTKFTTREKQPDGYWYFDMAARGQIKTYRTNRDDVIKAIDGYGVNAACCGLVFDENGDVIDCFNAAMAARGYVAAQGYDVTEIAEDGTSFTATRILSGNEVGKTYTSTIGPDTRIYNVNTTADFVGQVDKLQLGDRLYVIADTKGVAKVIFIFNRMVDSPMYYLLNRSFSSASGMTAKPDDAGWYNFTFAVKGKQVKLKTKDKALAEQIHGYGYCMMGLKVSGSVVLKAYNPECVSGNYSFAGNYFVQSFADPLLSAQSTSGTGANGVLTEGCEVYDVSGVDRVKGKKTTIREGDRIVCYTNAQGEITHVYITARYVPGTKLYWNINSRSYDGNTFSTKAEKNADGYYTFKVIKAGGKEVELKTTSKEVASQFHALATSAPIALKVSGTTLKAAYPGWSVVEGGGYYSLANTTVKEKTEEGDFRVLTTTQLYGTLKQGSDCKAYNVSGHKTYSKNRGETTTVRMGDRVYPIYSYQGAAKYVFVTVREQNTEVYYKYDRKYSTAKQETTRETDENGYYVYKVTVNGKVKEVKTKDKTLANFVDYYSLGFGLKLSGNIIKGVYPAESAPEVYGGQVSYRDVTKISGRNVTTKRNKPGQTDTGAVTEIELASNCLVVNVSPTAGDNWGKKTTLQRGDRIYSYKDDYGKTSIIYIMNECTRTDGGYAKCSECGKVVWWEPFTAGFSMAAGADIPKTAHYYLDGDLKRNSSTAFADGDQKTQTMKIVLDLYGRTMTRIGTESFDAETGESKGFFGSSGMVSVGQGNTLTIINTTKKLGGMYADAGVQFTGASILALASGDTAVKADDPATPENETAKQKETLGYDTAKFNEAGTLIIKAGIFDASKAVSTYKGANSGSISVGGNLIVKGGEIIGPKSTSTAYTATAAAIGTWGGSNVTIEGGIVRGCPVEEGDSAGIGSAAIAANSSNGTIKIAGGEVIGSHVDGSASAIFNRNGEMVITGGTIRGGIATESGKNIKISGKPVITNEYNGGIELRNGALLEVGKLEEGAQIFMNAVGIFTTDYETEDAAQADLVANYFRADNPVNRKDKALGIGEYRCLNRHYTKADCEAAGCTEEFYFWGKWTRTDGLPASGAYYLDSNVNVTAATSVAGELILDMNGKNINRQITVASDTVVYSVGLGSKLRLCDIAETAGTIKAVPTGIENDAVKSSNGLISGSSNNETGISTIVIDRITVDASAIQDNYYVGQWKTAESHLTASEKQQLADGKITALKDADDKVLVYLNASGVPIVRTAINAGAVVTGGDLTITGATIKGYQHTQGCGTAIGSWGGANIVINEGTTIIGGSANAVGSKNLFGAEEDYSAISNLGQGGAIAMGKGTLTINGGEIKCYDGAVTKHGGLIMMNSSAAPAALTINGGTFYGTKVTARGAVIHASSTPVTITGGTFYAGNAGDGGLMACAGKVQITGGTFGGAEGTTPSATNGGIIYNYGTGLEISGGTFNAVKTSTSGGVIYNAAKAKAVITGGEFNGIGNNDTNKPKNGGIVYNANGATMEITGGVMKNGKDLNGGWNIYNAGLMTIGGTAEIAGEVMGWGIAATATAEAKPAQFIFTGKPVIDYMNGEAYVQARKFNIRLLIGEIYIDNMDGEPVKVNTAKPSNVLSPKYACDGTIIGVVDGASIVTEAHDFGTDGKCTKCGFQAEGETRCANGHTTVADCEAADCTSKIAFFRPWEETTSLPKDGNWYLTDNVTVTALQGTTGDLQLDLKGKNITRAVPAGVTSNNYVIYIGADTTAVITDSTETPGTISATYADNVVTLSTGVLGIGSPVKDKTTNEVTTPGAILYLEKVTVDASTVENCTYTGANSAAVSNGGKLYIKNATVKGYKHTDGFGTALAGWGSSYTEISGANTLIIGGNATNATSGKGEGGVIAANGDWVINDGTFKVYDGTAASKHGGLIAMNGTSTMTINGGTFYGNEVTANGGVINHGKMPLTINGGTFYAAKANEGGIIRGTGKLVITGGTFEGTGNVAEKQCNYGGIIYNNGAEVSITGGTFNNGWDKQGGWNMYFTVSGSTNNKVFIGGTAQIAGEVLVMGSANARVELTIGDKAIIDCSLCSFGNRYNIRANKSDVFLKGNPTALFEAAGTIKLSLTHDTDGNVNGIVQN